MACRIVVCSSAVLIEPYAKSQSVRPEPSQQPVRSIVRALRQHFDNVDVGVEISVGEECSDRMAPWLASTSSLLIRAARDTQAECRPD